MPPQSQGIIIEQIVTMVNNRFLHTFTSIQHLINHFPDKFALKSETSTAFVGGLPAVMIYARTTDWIPTQNSTGILYVSTTDL